jgi:GNAT superfamily N-acetyltransferase
LSRDGELQRRDGELQASDGDVQLRPGRREDLEFIRRVHREAMGPHVERVWGRWDEAAQRARILESTDPTTHEIILLGGEEVGCWWVRSHPDALELVRLWILPASQGRGIGSQLVARLCARADRAGVPVRLRVLKANPARRLYEHHGFRIHEETETHFRMRRPAAG